jgi:16S rRNA (uracil1498-N3)-methyltransferase
MHRFFVEPSDIDETQISIRGTEDRKHMLKVLRMRVGGEIEVSDSQKYEYIARIASIDPDEIKAIIVEKHRFRREPKLQTTIYQAIPKQGKMDVIIQKCVELGMTRLIPVQTERSIATGESLSGAKLDRWRKVAQEAGKQCKRGFIPTIGERVSFLEMLPQFSDYDLVLFPYEQETGRTLKATLRNVKEVPLRVAILIGPEGGFTDEEATAVEAAGGLPVTLGKTILRTETAGPAALAMVLYELEL